MKNKTLALAAIILLAAGGVLLLKNRQAVPPALEQPVGAKPLVNDPGVVKTDNADYVLLDVPFTSQAPTGNWSDPRQQDGCEEASLLMAWSWVNGVKSIVPAEAEKTIIAMSEFEKQQYGNYLDLDAADTAKLMKDYFKYDKLTVRYNITIDDIKKELIAGHLVIVPANGRKLNNPNFTNGGPETHMLVIKGFNDPKNQIITNDPGTRNGRSYVYSYSTIYDAMVDYPSGHHEDQTGRPKAMIVVYK